MLYSQSLLFKFPFPSNLKVSIARVFLLPPYPARQPGKIGLCLDSSGGLGRHLAWTVTKGSSSTLLFKGRSDWLQEASRPQEIVQAGSGRAPSRARSCRHVLHSPLGPLYLFQLLPAAWSRRGARGWEGGGWRQRLWRMCLGRKLVRGLGSVSLRPSEGC